MADSEKGPTLTTKMKGIVLEVAAPYAVGHRLTEAEARVLNQSRAENIISNARTRWTKWQEAHPDVSDAKGRDKLLELVSDLDEDYDLNNARVRSTLSDEEKVAKEIAREQVKQKLSEANLTIAQYGRAKYEELVTRVSQKDEVVKVAAKQVEAMRKVPAPKLDDLQV